MSERLRGTALERAQTAALMRNSGSWTADDARATFDQPPLPDGRGAYTTLPLNSELLLQALAVLQISEGEGEIPEMDESILTPSPGSPRADDLTGLLVRALSRRGGASNGKNGHGRENGSSEARAVLEALTRERAPEIHLRPEINLRPEFRLEQPGVTIYQEAARAPEITFAPEVRVEQPEVHVAPAEVRVDIAPATINVPAAEVRVEVPASEPVVNVAAPDVTVNVPPAEVRVETREPVVNVTPEIHLPPTRTVKTVERDEEGRVTRIVEDAEEE
jgi:hypothetical protein